MEPDAATGLPWQRHNSPGAYSHGGLQKAGSLDVSKRVGRRVSLRVEGLGKGEIEEGGVWPLLAAKTLAGVVSQPSLFLAVL